MEITGCDNVLFTWCDPRPVLLEVLKKLAERWPRLRIELANDFESSEDRNCRRKRFTNGVLPTLSDLFEEHCEAVVVRDEAMEEHYRERFHVPMPDGDGVVMLIYRPRHSIVFRLDKVIEVERDDPCGIDPYEGWLASPRLVEITAVTPEHPSEHSFSGWVWNHVLRACVDLK